MSLIRAGYRYRPIDIKHKYRRANNTQAKIGQATEVNKQEISRKMSTVHKYNEKIKHDEKGINKNLNDHQPKAILSLHSGPKKRTEQFFFLHLEENK